MLAYDVDVPAILSLSEVVAKAFQRLFAKSYSPIGAIVILKCCLKNITLRGYILICSEISIG